VGLAGVPGGELLDPVAGWLVVVEVGLPAQDGVDGRVLAGPGVAAREAPVDRVGIAVGLGVPGPFAEAGLRTSVSLWFGMNAWTL
jgi:hypothetical protein